MLKIVKTGRNQDWFGFDFIGTALDRVMFVFLFVSVFQLIQTKLNLKGRRAAPAPSFVFVFVFVHVFVFVF